MQRQADEDELGLSSVALAALKEFALENNLLGLQQGVDTDDDDVRLQVQERMDVKKKTHEFRFTFGEDGDGEKVSIALSGVNPELGQTLASTGLTVWRAAEEMARFMWEHRRWFAGKRVVELGAGLGLCGVLASKLCVGGTVVITDGGEEFTDSAMDALRRNLERNSCNLGARQRGSSKDGAAAAASAPAAGDAEVFLERLTWGEHEEFLEGVSGGGGGGRCGEDHGGCDGGGGAGGFDFIVAADVIYEEEAVSPLLHTVVDILKLRRADDIPSDRVAGAQQEQEQQQHKTPPETRAGGSRRNGEEPSDVDDAATASGAPGLGDDPVRAVAIRGDVSSVPPEPARAPQALLSPPPPAASTFLLAFARRNVSIDRVLREAESLGLRWRVPEDFKPNSVSENVYLMWLES